ncbi:MAG TPA: hypothetical protein VID29_08580 [Solirubrobacteraceae bacterium]|jgi:hypothetical protein
MTVSKKRVDAASPQDADATRDPLAAPAAVLAARRRPMSERLELALSWNSLAAELRAGLAAAAEQTSPRR